MEGWWWVGVVVLGCGQFGEWESRCSPCSSVHRVTARLCGCDGSDALRVGVAGTRRSGGEGRRDEVREQRPDQTDRTSQSGRTQCGPAILCGVPSRVVWVALGCSTPSSSGGTAHPAACQQHASSSNLPCLRLRQRWTEARQKLGTWQLAQGCGLQPRVGCQRGSARAPSPWHQPIPLCPATGASIHTTESRTSRCTFMYP